MRISRWLLPVLLLLPILAGCQQQPSWDPGPTSPAVTTPPATTHGPSRADIDQALSEKISDMTPPLGAAEIGSYEITYGPVADGPESRIDAVPGGSNAPDGLVVGWPYLLDVTVHAVDAYGAPVSDEPYLDHSNEIVWFYQWPTGGDWHFQTS